MSQYPSPYPPSPYPHPQPPIDFSYYTPQANLLGPARRAAILQGILGGLVLACGVCLGAFPWLINVNEAIAQSGMTIPQMPAGMNVESLFRTVYTVAGVVGALVGIAMLVLSFFVRNGARGPAIASIAIVGLVVALLLLNVIGALIQMASNPAVGIFSLLIIAVLLAAFGLNMAWLASAIRGASRVDMARQHYAAQYHQYQQQQQTYGQQGAYGVPYAPQPYAAQPYGYPPQPLQSAPSTPSQPQPGQPPPGSSYPPASPAAPQPPADNHPNRDE